MSEDVIVWEPRIVILGDQHLRGSGTEEDPFWWENDPPTIFEGAAALAWAGRFNEPLRACGKCGGRGLD